MPLGRKKEGNVLFNDALTHLKKKKKKKKKKPIESQALGKL